MRSNLEETVLTASALGLGCGADPRRALRRAREVHQDPRMRERVEQRERELRALEDGALVERARRAAFSEDEIHGRAQDLIALLARHEVAHEITVEQLEAELDAFDEEPLPPC